MELITVEVGTTKLQTPSPALARRVLEAATGLDQVPLFDLPNITSLIPPAIGQYWQGQGGFYAGLMRGQDGQPDYHLVVTAADLGETKAITWGGKGESKPGAASLAAAPSTTPCELPHTTQPTACAKPPTATLACCARPPTARTTAAN